MYVYIYIYNHIYIYIFDWICNMYVLAYVYIPLTSEQTKLQSLNQWCSPESLSLTFGASIRCIQYILICNHY